MQCNEKPRLTPGATLIWLALLVLCGCQSPQPEREPTAPADPVAAILSEADQERVDGLLSRADAALAADHLTYPAKDSALTLFDAVLAIDPTSAAARRGLERIVERYVEMAERAAARGQGARARSMLDRARIVDPDHPAVRGDPGHLARRLDLRDVTRPVGAPSWGR